jgi:hypothetical protein
MLTVWTLLIFANPSLPTATIFRSPETCAAAMAEAVRHIPERMEALCVQSVIPAGLARR